MFIWERKSYMHRYERVCVCTYGKYIGTDMYIYIDRLYIYVQYMGGNVLKVQKNSFAKVYNYDEDCRMFGSSLLLGPCIFPFWEHPHVVHALHCRMQQLPPPRTALHVRLGCKSSEGASAESRHLHLRLKLACFEASPERVGERARASACRQETWGFLKMCI